MQKLFLFALLLPLLAHAADQKAPPPLTAEEQKLAEAGMKILEAEDKNPHKKPMPQHLRDKMQSGFGDVAPETKAKKKAAKN
jgi:hypothetical protein